MEICTCNNHPTDQTHGAWLRSKNLTLMQSAMTSSTGVDRTQQKQWDKRIDSYRAERKQGNKPAGTQPDQIRQAQVISDHTGQAFDALTPMAGLIK